MTRRLFPLVTSVITDGLGLLADGSLIIAYLIRARWRGVSAVSALQHLGDEVDDRALRGLCVNLRCAVPRAAARWRLAQQLGSTTIPGQRSLPAADGARDWFEAPQPIGELAPQESGAVCFTCGAPTPGGASCQHCAQLLAPEPLLLDDGDDPAAAADAWVLDHFGPELLESLPNLCEHPAPLRWVLDDGTMAVRCPGCDAQAVSATPYEAPVLAPVWCFADGETAPAVLDGGL